MAVPPSTSDPVAPTVRGLLDAYDVPACIIGADRIVIAANGASRSFAASAEPGLRLTEGQAWPDLCRAAEAGGASGFGAADMIERLSRSSAASASVEYVARSPCRFKSFRLSATRIADGRGNVLVVQADITRTRVVEQRLADTEQRLGDMAALFSEWLWSTDEDLRFVEVAAPRDAFWRRLQPHLVGRSLDEVFGGVAGPAVDVRRRQPLRDATATVELDGVIHVLRFSGKPQFAGNGAFAGYLGIAADVTRAQEAEEAREVAERRLRDIVEMWTDWFWETDAEHRFVYRSETLGGRVQLDEERLLGRRRIDLIDREMTDPDQVARHLDDLDNHRPFRDFLYACRNLGRLRHLQVGGRPRFDSTGRFTGYVGTARDVTAVMAATAEKDAAERRLKAAIDQLPSGIAIWDDDDRLVAHNADYLALAGFVPDRPIIGATFEEILRELHSRGAIPPAGGDSEAQVKARVAVHRNPAGPIEISLATGRIVQLRERRLADGGTVSVASDITTLKERERALSQQRAMLQTILDHISDGILAVDEDWKITAANDTFCDLLGLPRELAGIGLPFARALEWLAGRGDYGPGEATAQAGRIVGSMAGRTRWYDERVVPDGRQIAWRVRLMQGGGRIIAVADVSEQRDADRRREQLRATMAQAEKLEAVAQLAGGMAHDLNNALQPIIALTEAAIEEMPIGSGSRTDLEKVVAAAERAHGLVQRLLTFSGAGDRKSSGRLDPAVKDALDMVRATIGPNITVSATFGAGDTLVPLGAAEIQQIVTNLGLNAVQAIGERPGRISFATALLDADEDRLRTFPGRDSARRYARLRVSDDGPGIPPDVLPRIFEPFFTTKEVGKGTGLGLAVIHGLIGRAGGWIDAKSAMGAEFDVFLPLIDTDDVFMGDFDGTHSSDR